MDNYTKTKFNNMKGDLNELHLSDQALGAIMMALQKSLMEQTDIVPMLQGFEVQVDDAGQLVIINPPKVEVKKQKSVVITDVNMDGPL